MLKFDSAWIAASSPAMTNGGSAPLLAMTAEAPREWPATPTLPSPFQGEEMKMKASPGRN